MKIALDWGFITVVVDRRYINCGRGRIILFVKQDHLDGADRVSLKNCLQDAIWSVLGEEATIARFRIVEGDDVDEPIADALASAAEPAIYDIKVELDLELKEEYRLIENLIKAGFELMYVKQLQILKSEGLEVVHA